MMNCYHWLRGISRKSLWLAIFLCSTTLSLAADNSTRRLTILTSFPPKFYVPFVEKFESAHPDFHFCSE